MVATPTTSIGFQNFYSSTLSADITATSTDIFINTVPSVSESFLVIDPDNTTGREVIYYNSKTATKVTCPSAADGRGQGDTTAAAHLTGTTVIMAPIAEYFETLLSLFTTSPQGWTTGSGTISAVTNNGNRSYSLTTSADLSATISNGMRLRTTRTVAAPTQCTSLNGTTQYYSKTTPAGMTFTDDFVVSAWVKLSSYAGGTIISRFNGTSGFNFNIATSGQAVLTGFNGGVGNNSQITSYQSIPLNKWVHITAQLDMSAFTATTTTSYIMLDGVDAPSYVARAGTNPTALIQAGDLQIGAYNGATTPFPGKIAQAAVFSAKVTQATMRGYMSQGLAGTETSLISAYSFNNSINDLNTTNANNLTANGSAVATNADSPFGGRADGTISSTLDYGIITQASASTLTVQVPEGNTIPTSGGVSAFSYSTYKAPYGMPADSKFKLSAYDTSGTLTEPIITSLLAYVTDHPIDNMKFTNSGNAGGAIYVNVIGSERKLDGLTNAISTSAGGFSDFTINIPITLSIAPNVVATATNQTATAKQHAAIPTVPSTTTFNVRALNYDSIGGTTQISWIAIGG